MLSMVTRVEIIRMFLFITSDIKVLQKGDGSRNTW